MRAFQACRRTQAAWSAAIAQLVEHVIRNDGVTGSNPVCGTSDRGETNEALRQKPLLDGRPNPVNSNRIELVFMLFHNSYLRQR